jgi:hypothetical protein
LISLDFSFLEFPTTQDEYSGAFSGTTQVGSSQSTGISSFIDDDISSQNSLNDIASQIDSMGFEEEEEDIANTNQELPTHACV